MQLQQLLWTLQRIKGATFASLDATTRPAPGIRKVTLRERVLLFNSGVSGYERMVRRRLEQEGLDPDSFSVGDLPWGSRVPDLPSCVLTHNGAEYLQTILLGEGDASYHTLTGQPLSLAEVGQFLPRTRDLSSGDNSQGLPNDRAVRVHSYALSSIQAIRLLGETLAA